MPFTGSQVCPVMKLRPKVSQVSRELRNRSSAMNRSRATTTPAAKRDDPRKSVSARRPDPGASGAASVRWVIGPLGCGSDEGKPYGTRCERPAPESEARSTG